MKDREIDYFQTRVNYQIGYKRKSSEALWYMYWQKEIVN